jgi:DNA-binding NarL/FixJ family response regulator
MTLFNLTWSEVRVLEQIVSGRNRKEAAAVLGVADSTVKTHLDNIYAKTGTSDQVGLCRLAAKLSWPICLVERRHERN